MFEWFFKYFTKSDRELYDSPKCNKCGLVSSKDFKIEIIGEEVERVLLGKICESCIEDMYRSYDPMWIPPLVFKEE